MIKDILIAFIKENSVIEYKEDENGKILFDEYKNPIVEKAYNTKSNIVLQTIIDKLFRDDGCKIYAKYPTDLSKTVLKRIDFAEAQLQNANFTEAQLQNGSFGDIYFFFNANSIGTQLQNANFTNAQLQNANLVGAQLQNANFRQTQLQNQCRLVKVGLLQ